MNTRKIKRIINTLVALLLLLLFSMLLISFINKPEIKDIRFTNLNEISKSNIETQISTSTTPPSVPESNNLVLPLQEIVKQMSEARFLNEQRELLSRFKGQILELSFRVNSIDRSFGIGISEEYKGGNTLLVTSDSNEIEVRVKKDVDTDKILSGTEMNSVVSVADWNGIRKRLVVNLH